MAKTPFNIIAGPAFVYVAPVATAFPSIDTDPPGGSWALLGRTEGGVNVAHNESVTPLRIDQLTGPVKLIRTEETLVITFGLAEIDLEAYAYVLNSATVTDTAAGSGTAGHRAIPLYMGPDVALLAMLVRGPSPYMDAFMQYEVPVVGQTASPTLDFTRTDKAVLKVSWTAIEDPDAVSEATRFGTLRAQDAAAL